MDMQTSVNSPTGSSVQDISEIVSAIGLGTVWGEMCDFTISVSGSSLISLSYD